jgi:hypothetical protein
MFTIKVIFSPEPSLSGERICSRNTEFPERGLRFGMNWLADALGVDHPCSGTLRNEESQRNSGTIS